MIYFLIGIFGIVLLALMLWMFREPEKEHGRDEMKPDQWWTNI